MLTDKHVHAAHKLLKKQFPEKSRDASPLLSSGHCYTSTSEQREGAWAFVHDTATHTGMNYTPAQPIMVAKNMVQHQCKHNTHTHTHTHTQSHTHTHTQSHTHTHTQSHIPPVIGAQC